MLRRAMLLTCLAPLVGCDPMEPARHGAEGAPVPRVSLFSQRSSFTDDQGKQVTFSSFRGAPVVLSAIYTSCARTCPVTLAELRKMDAAFRKGGIEVHFLVVTLDPHEDTPDRLHEYKLEKKLPEAWRLLQGSDGATDDLASLLDVHVMDMTAHLVHDANIAVFDANGTMVKRFATGEYAAEAASVAQALAGSAPR